MKKSLLSLALLLCSCSSVFSQITIFAEDFANFKNIAADSQISSSDIDRYTRKPGWDVFAIYGTRDSSVLVGAMGSPGYIMTPAIESSGESLLIVEFDAASYNTDGNSVIVSVFKDEQELATQTIVLTTSRATYRCIFENIPSGCKIKFASAARRKRIILYNVNIMETLDIPEIDGIYYLFSEEKEEAIVTHTSTGYNSYSGNLVIPDSVTFSGKNYRVTEIGYRAFYNCTGLTSVTIPESVTAIGASAFSGCSNLTTVILESNALVSASRTSSTSMSSIFGNQVQAYIIGDNVNFIGDNTFYECDDRLYVNQGTDALLAVWNYGVDPYETGTEAILSSPSISVLSTTQTTITYQINIVYPELEYEFVGESVDENTYTITGQRPEYTQTVPLTVHSANNQYSTSANVTTLPISPTITSKNVTASSLSAKGSYIEGDAQVIASSLVMNGTEMEDVEGTLHGLNPNTSYSCKYTVVVEYGDGETYSYVDSKNIKTANLTLVTQQPKVINAGNVVVSAESNLDDEETNVGFEWRRIDWTEDFASNTGAAYLYEGKMEGYIRNLYIEKLWKYRPYYESNSGNRYYGDWVGIDPTNTSYFEPTVHTYAQITVTGNRAEVKGYAMRGTDNVLSQGFMYWPTSTSVSLRRKTASVPSGAIVVNASGNVMTATLEDLEYETTYKYVAFVTTSEGETFYGEIQNFSTSVAPDGIREVQSSESIVHSEGIYDLSGRKLDKPQKGINIIRMSDGTTKKVLIK